MGLEPRCSGPAGADSLQLAGLLCTRARNARTESQADGPGPGTHTQGQGRHSARSPTPRNPPTPTRGGALPAPPGGRWRVFLIRESLDCLHRKLPHARPPLLCAPIEMQTSRVPRPQSACPHPHPALRCPPPPAGAGWVRTLLRPACRTRVCSRAARGGGRAVPIGLCKPPKYCCVLLL